ncbi:MAG: hypothetical protein H6537_11885 [Bacteroidales bacterium]|nr:hypothetical protein [Bacteroidales bacterium]
MNRQEEHIEMAIKKALLVGLFLLALIIFKESQSFNNDSLFSQHRTIELVSEANHTATVVAPFTLHTLDNLLPDCEIFSVKTFNNNTVRLLYSNSIENKRFRFYKEQFIKVKPYISHIRLLHFQTSLNNDKVPSIS